MISIHFPECNFKIRREGVKEVIFDALRKQWLVLTPEEWVRQNFIQYLLLEMQYPAALIGLEKEITIGELRKRFDIIVFDNAGKPWMLIECKAMSISLSENTLEQVLIYNQAVQADYLIITNGTFTKGFQLRPLVKEIEKIPVFNSFL